MMKLKTWIASATAALLTACGSVDVAHYAAEKPTLELPTFFNGTIDAWGIFQKRSGEVVAGKGLPMMSSVWQPDVCRVMPYAGPTCYVCQLMVKST